MIKYITIREGRWMAEFEKAQCPKCGQAFDALELVNDKGLDFEGNSNRTVFEMW